MKLSSPVKWKVRSVLQRANLLAPSSEQLLSRRLKGRQTQEKPARQEYRFIFIVGASGSGTTMLTRVLSGPPGVVCLGGQFTTIPATDETATLLARYFNKAITRLWDRKGPLALYQQSRQMLPHLVAALLEEEGYRNRSHVIYKRSAPFNPGDRNRPDLSDLFETFSDARIVVIYRDPRASTYSSMRRGFAENLRACAVICEEQLTYLSAQLATFDPGSYLVVNYEDFCARPEAWTGPLARFCGLAEEDIAQAIRQEGVKARTNERWQQELGTAEVEFLRQFFNSRRLTQWPLLSAAPVTLL
ncbi:MAG: sulfotransferase [Chloroflexi bacterium]|nr:sulfotransferase [Chloroflexota bacterium]MCI0645870.1 sulfotransferase [Chloroflexota bacterium]MCI0725725.1 sulfotransferase [Chloroflexota bacterium]